MCPLIAKWRGEGKKVIMLLDEGFGNSASYNSTKSMSNEIKSDLIDFGLIPKADKSLWEPVQILEWLGVVLNSKEFIVYIPESRVQKALSTIEYLVETRRVPVKTVASFVGQMISMSVVFGPLTQIMTHYLSIDVLRARTWSAFISLLGESRQQLLFWLAPELFTAMHLVMVLVGTKLILLTRYRMGFGQSKKCKNLQHGEN